MKEYSAPAPDTASRTEQSDASTPRQLHLLVVDLNQFTSFPTLAVGILAASLRNRGHNVEVICPLELGVSAAERERQETWFDYAHTRIRLSDVRWVRTLREFVRTPRLWYARRPRAIVLREVEKALEIADAVLLSAYLDHDQIVKSIGQKAKARNVPLILGGPMFNLEDVSDTWRSFQGVSAVVGAEVDRNLPKIVEALCNGDDLSGFPGLVFPDGERTPKAPPLRNLDDTPIPNFNDFPWTRYPKRIVPVLTGRGCQWDKCTFCSDVISASGRTFRARSLANVLAELQIQAERYDTKDFLFLDLKLNSFPEMFRGLACEIQQHVQNAEWIGTVHVDQRMDNGLSRRDLFDASEGGMRRISFGLESGSQKLLDKMQKGCSVERNAVFLRDAYDAGLSVRCTMFKGYPGETAADMEATAAFLEANAPFIDRVRFNDFALLLGTPVYTTIQETGELPLTGVDSKRACALYGDRGVSRSYRRAKKRVLQIVHQINSKSLRETASQFDGLM